MSVASVRTERHPACGCRLGATALSADEAFQRIKELGGADVILELVGGPHMDANVGALARGGRLRLVASSRATRRTVVLRDLMSAAHT